MDPDQVGALSLMLVPGTPLHERAERGEFVLPDAHGILAELREMLAGTELTRGLFLADHASNYCPSRSGSRPARRRRWRSSTVPARRGASQARVGPASLIFSFSG